MKAVLYGKDSASSRLGILYFMDDKNYDNHLKIVETIGTTDYHIVEIDNYDIVFRYIQCYQYDHEKYPWFKFDEERFKEICYQTWRHRRQKKFETLDKEFIIALEKGDEGLLDEIKKKKNELRDVTKTSIVSRENWYTVKEYITKVEENIPDCLK